MARLAGGQRPIFVVVSSNFSVFEPLDRRQLLAAVSFVGTEGNDVVAFQTISTATLRMTIGAKRHTIDLRKIDLIQLQLLGGGDRVTFENAPPKTLRLHIDGGSGNDTLYGSHGNDTLLGGGGNDFISDGPGNDFVDGGGGDDHLFSGAGNDTIKGGAGHDRIRTEAANRGYKDKLFGGTGNDLITVTHGTATLSGEAGNDTLTAGSESATLQGGDGDDSLVGGSGDDLITGGFGIDTLKGNAGNDTLWGGEDTDHLSGGAGIDEFHGGSGDDFIRSIDLVFNELVDGGSGKDTAYVDRDETTGKPRDLLQSIEKLV